MPLSAFLRQMFDAGRVQAPRLDALLLESDADAGGVLAAFERAYCLDLPGTPPALSLPAARWGAGMLFRACQFLVYRDADSTVIAQTFATPCPEAPNPETHYSVDLALRFLPDVYRFAIAANANDPLAQDLVRLCGRWPLSSVGVKGAAVESLTNVADHPCLLAMYVDRIIGARDISRLSDPHVRMAVRTAIGSHAELAPEISAALTAYEMEGNRS